MASLHWIVKWSIRLCAFVQNDAASLQTSTFPVKTAYILIFIIDYFFIIIIRLIIAYL